MGKGAVKKQLGLALSDFIRETIGEPRLGLELGVCRADTSVCLMEQFPYCDFVFVDPWQVWPLGSSYRAHHLRTGSLSQRDWDAIRSEALAAIELQSQVHSTKTTVHRAVGADVVHLYDDRAFDFVFIDANHTYESVLEDIQLWLPKCRGLICGHDYGGTYKGVKRAVHEVFSDGDVIEYGRQKLWGVHLSKAE